MTLPYSPESLQSLHQLTTTLGGRCEITRRKPGYHQHRPSASSEETLQRWRSKASSDRLLAAQGLRLAFEDSGKGLKAAMATDILTIETPNAFTAHHDFAGALRVLPSLEGGTVAG
ncbi:hypothetical protein GCM10027292_09000 [Hydrogenophaga aquatica]